MYYLMQFFRMSMTKRKVAVCLSAFLFGPAYLLYRKMWKEGLLTALLSIVLSVPSLIAIVATFNRRCSAVCRCIGCRGRRRLCHCGLDRQDFAGAFLGLAVPQHLKEKY